MATRIQLRGDTAANWASNNPTLAAREFAVETDTLRIKVGNGNDAYNTLEYASVPSYNGLDKAVAGNSLDARQGKALKGLIDDNSNFRYLGGGNILLTDTVVAGFDNSSTPVILPLANTCKGKKITLVCSADDTPFYYSVQTGNYITTKEVLSTSGGEIVQSTGEKWEGPKTQTIMYPFGSKTFVSDGVSNWFEI